MTKGFTLIEIMVVMGIFIVLVSFGTIVDLNVLKSDTLRAEESTVVSVLTKARSRAMSNYSGDTHGVCYLAPNYVIFKGNDCSASGSDLVPANTNIATASGFPGTFSPVVFNQLSGNVSGSTIDIIIKDGVKEEKITINNEGTINW